MKHLGDKYSGFEELNEKEDPNSFGIVCEVRDSVVVVAAPHGGGIEPGTSELAMAIAQEDLSVYCFEGRKRSNNRDLHITSERFDEPMGIALVRSGERVVTVHGEGSAAEFVRVGGLDRRRVEKLRAALRDAGFTTDAPPNATLAGISPRNICNSGKSGAGVQLEISRGLRDALLGRNGAEATRAAARCDTFTRAVRAVLLAS